MVSHELTEEMFEKRDQIGIWFIGEKEYDVSEADYAASMYEEMEKKDLDLYPADEPDGNILRGLS